MCALLDKGLAMRFQFALFALAVLIANVTVAEDIVTEAKAIEKIKLLGGAIMRDDKQPDQPVIGVFFRKNPRVRDGFLRLLKAFPRLAIVDLAETKVTDAGMKELGGLP